MVDVARSAPAVLQALTSQGTTASAVKVLPKQQLDIKPSAQAERFIANVTSSTKLSPSSKQSLIEISAIIDQHLVDTSARNHAFIDVAGLSVLLSDSASEGFPKYILMTGLRFYAAVADALPAPLVDQATVEQQVTAKIDSLAKATTGKSLEQVRSIVQQDIELQKAAIAQVGQRVDVEGFADSDSGSGAPTTVTFA